MQDLLACGFVLPKATTSGSLFSSFSSYSGMLISLGEPCTKQACCANNIKQVTILIKKCSINKHGVASGQADSDNGE
jgi:hypothetical protein